MNADSFFKRLKGLMFTKNLSSQSALLIYPCSEIHTYFMNYSIDVLYLDVNNKIIAVDESMKPGKIGKYRKGSTSVVELSSGTIQQSSTKVGQTVKFI
jgi:uncharacterized membrane protein (UPF0127 family)